MKKFAMIILPFAMMGILLLGACASTTTTTPTTFPVSSPAVTPSAQSATQETEALPSTNTVAPELVSDTSGMGLPSNGAPPNGAPPNGGGTTSATDALTSATGAYTLDGGAAAETDKTYTAANTDESSVYVINGSLLHLINPIVTKTGSTSSSDYSSFYGLNAGILATTGSRVTIEGGMVNTQGAGANGIFATGSGTIVTASNTTVNAVGDGAHAVMATNAGTLILNNVDMITTDTHSGALATDRGGGAITADGGTVTTSGQDSPAIYSTGAITVSNATLSATGAEAAVIEGANAIVLINDTLSSSVADKWGVMIYQSFSGDAEGSEGHFTMLGGSLAYTAATGPLFYVTNSTGFITLQGVNITAASGTLVRAEGNDRWGSSGANGGTANLTTDGQTLMGELTADNISSLAVSLQNGSSLTGAINADNTALAANLTLDATSTWTVTANSYLTCLSDSAGTSGAMISNINGNGYIVYYNPSACAALKGQTYSLNGVGALKPIN